MKAIDQAGDLKGKMVFLRADFDVPVGAMNIIREEFRIARQKENLHYLLDRGARVIIAAHIEPVISFGPLVSQLQRILGVQMTFCKDRDQVKEFLAHTGTVALLENVRTNPGEESNDAAFAGQLVAGCDLYVNNAFAVSHREHASLVSAPLMLPAYAGLLLKEEISRLSKFISEPAQGKVIYMGGAKSSTKVPVIKNLINKAEYIAVGGVVANDILKELGQDIGSSQADENSHELLAGLDLADKRLVIPVDSVDDDGRMADIGPKTIEAFAALTVGAKLIIWNGPMGRYEDARFAVGTRALTQAMIASGAFTVIGGIDTITAVDHFGLLDKIGFVSTGGGAMLAFLAGQQLPGLKALGYYDQTH